jgi:hypothetical protein
LDLIETGRSLLQPIAWGIDFAIDQANGEFGLERGAEWVAAAGWTKNANFLKTASSAGQVPMALVK